MNYVGQFLLSIRMRLLGCLSQPPMNREGGVEGIGGDREQKGGRGRRGKGEGGEEWKEQ